MTNMDARRMIYGMRMITQVEMYMGVKKNTATLITPHIFPQADGFATTGLNRYVANKRLQQ